MLSSEEAEQETRALEQVLAAYSGYKSFAQREYYLPRYKKWRSLSDHQKELIPWYGDYLEDLRNAIECNAAFLQEVVLFAQAMVGISSNVNQWPTPSRVDMEKTVSMISQVYREWSQESKPERDLSTYRILQGLQAYEKQKGTSRNAIKVLIPGAGTGRLMADLVIQGYNCESNEFSYHMLVMSMYILNGGLKEGQKKIYPFIHAFSHWKSRTDQLKPISIPDFNIHEQLAHNDRMAMSSGSFIDCYGSNEKIRASNTYSISPAMKLTRAQMESVFDVVITNFFIDTASNIIDYLHSISHVLTPGGLWINFGPLLYHFECDDQVEDTYEVDPFTGEKTDIHEDVPLKGLELTADEILEVSINKLNFKCLDKEFAVHSGYGRSPSLNAVPGYMCNYWVLQKEGMKQT
ncbi:hypothetical protein ZYGR_0I06540 [Zygosaccharomyces rouxii]|uniref:carnosine N-methyltransferase n=2 Tax=Zygosaccharomyces rouxii TaxID=4956 RepID=C5DUB9_ZYGRC|nr:uncharacterized protein ZYRO0C15532g [Zygosaccharomyces rouxii]KAH9201447.1 N2227-like protein-domain-containing protein [Zygosaccharomyces rouxii]GAV48357.1 hypothetical protein ZYGR_0I06540 [Zygosaccharomyces rouxii]CAR27380.1 ZYRO0C15532p [Zygosaccharomyces rouxii]